MKGPLIVSMTSHPPRYQDLPFALDSILSQTYKPDAVVLWLAEHEWKALPDHIKDMGLHPLLHFRLCEDLRSYKNSIPAFDAYPDAYIITCGDDTVFPPSYVQCFVEAHRSDKEILSQHARRVTLKDGKIAPYIEWPRARYGESGRFVFPSSRGIMFPPRSLHNDVMDKETFMRLCPHADDIWKYWMALKAGSVHRHIKPTGMFRDLPSASNGLYQQFNRDGGNDRQIAAMVEAYGSPWHQQEVAA